jgi:hypothetical protein
MQLIANLFLGEEVRKITIVESHIKVVEPRK